MSIQAIRSGLVNMRILIILLTMVASFISVVGVVIIAKLFGIQPNYFHDPEKILDPNVIVAVLGILIAPIAIVFLTQRYFFKGSIEDLGMKKPFLFPFI